MEHGGTFGDKATWGLSNVNEGVGWVVDVLRMDGWRFWSLGVLKAGCYKTGAFEA